MKWIASIFCLLLLISCDRSLTVFTDFSELEGADETAFHIMSSKVTDLSNGLPEHCVAPIDTKTSSISINTVVSDIIEFHNKNEVLEIAGTYECRNLATGEPLILSGKILLPKGRKPKRYLLVSHYTMGSNEEAPSNSFPIDGVMCNLGYAMIYPDYQGYGVSSDRMHPYLVLQQTAYEVCTMFEAARRFLKNTKYAPEHDEVYLMGYSQGGAVTMATQWMMEEIRGEGNLICGVFTGGGPYDIKAIVNHYIESDHAGIPCVVPMIAQAMLKDSGLDIMVEDILQPWLSEKMDEWINSKKYYIYQLTEIMGTSAPSRMLSKKAMDMSDPHLALARKCLDDNSVSNLDWTPKAPVYIFHSTNDDIIPANVAIKAAKKWANGNITKDFADYGSHASASMKFYNKVARRLKKD